MIIARRRKGVTRSINHRLRAKKKINRTGQSNSIIRREREEEIRRHFAKIDGSSGKHERLSAETLHFLIANRGR